MAFNIFKVLEKDDKELIHSSFLKFLLSEDKIFAESVLGYNLPNDCKIELEKSHTLKFPKRKNKRFRFDIEIVDNDTVIVIENKFKSFPTAHQLKEYDKVLNQDYKKHTQIKILLCFDKSLFGGVDGWKVMDYGDLLPLIKQSKERISDAEKRIFIQHYIDFLSEYYDIHKTIDDKLLEYFLDQSDKVAKFWIRLIYSKLAIKLDNYLTKNNIEASVYMDNGNTSIPLINIVPNEWKINGYELLVQFQGGYFKFYAHTSDKAFIQELVDFSKNKAEAKNVDYKKINKKKEKSAFIFRLDIREKLYEVDRLTEEEVFEYLTIFYNKVDKVIEMYKSDKGLN
ncbi:MAG: PD-(D/E)XK nuclease family protein [Carboxylicivirga sp.]|jgi:hypothetical protein|nr:PD-(D/E)XK nuclease family protein [Carboxylicivirga sp.]